MTTHNNFLPLFATVLFIIMIAVNVLANALPINGLTTGEVSDLYPNLFTPSGITFSIWSVIYFFLGGTVIVTWTNLNHVLVRNLLPLFCVSCILNSLWIVAWHYLLPDISVIIMLSLLGVLIVAFRKIYAEEMVSNKFTLWLKFPFTIYLAWISVATIANIAAWLVSVNFNGLLSAQSWTVIMIGIATGLAVLITSHFRSPWYSVVVMWALFGIFLRMRRSEYDYIMYASILCMIILLINLLFAVRRSNVVPTR
jgi:hypothetical protein